METLKVLKTQTSVRAFILVAQIILGALAVTMIARQEEIHRAWKILEVSGTLIVSIFSCLLVVFLRWTNVQESTAKALMRSGKFHTMFFSKEDHRLVQPSEEIYKDTKVPFLPELHDPYDLIEAPGYQYWKTWPLTYLGGLRFYIWWFEYIYTYTWDWLKSMPDGSIIPRHRGADSPEGPEDSILVGYDYPYGIVMGKGIITSDNYPVEVTVILRGQITNPYKALFNVKWFEQLAAGTRSPTKDYINSHTYQEIRVVAGKSTHEELYEDLGERDVISLMKDNYGFHLLSAGLSKIILSPEHERLALEQKQGEMDAARDAAKRLGSTTMPFISMLAAELGATNPDGATDPKKVAQLRRMYVRHPAKFEERYGEVIKRSERFINRQIDADAGALKRIDITGGLGVEHLFMLLGEAFSGKGGGSAPSQASNGNGKNGGSAPSTRRNPPPGDTKGWEKLLD